MKTGPFKMNPGFNKLPADVQAKILKKAPTKMYGKSPAKKDKKGMSVMDFDDTQQPSGSPKASKQLRDDFIKKSSQITEFAKNRKGIIDALGKINFKKDEDLTKKKGLGPRAAPKKKAPMKNYKKGYYGA